MLVCGYSGTCEMLVVIYWILVDIIISGVKSPTLTFITQHRLTLQLELGRLQLSYWCLWCLPKWLVRWFVASGFNVIILWKRLFKGSGKPGKLTEFHFAKFVCTLTILLP